MKGGKREGAGRPSKPPTQTVSIRLSKAQHAGYIERGGARWVKRLIDELIEAKRLIGAV
jgi:hypothetical protein